MLDNELIALVISTIIASEEVAGIPDTPIKQAFQPTQQGANIDKTAYIFKVGDSRHGFPYRVDLWDDENLVMVHKEIQQYATTFQISALSTQSPSTPTAHTASDLLNLIAYTLQNSNTVSMFESHDVGILRIGDVRNPYFMNEKQRFEASPSLDFVLTHKQIITSEVPVIYATELQILTV